MDHYTNGHDTGALDGPGLYPGPGDAPDGPGPEDAGGWTDREAGSRGHGPDWRPDDWRTPVRLSDIPDDGAKPPLVGFLASEPGSVTVLHGDGGAGKGSLAAFWVSQVTNAGGRVLVLDMEGHPTEWRRRVEGLGGELGKVLWVGHRTGYLAPQGMAGMVDLVVVDSAGYLRLEDAPATDWGPDVPVMLQDAAKVSGVPWLVLAHHSKTSDGKRAFGSVFWHNVPRASYSLVRNPDDSRVLTCHKATDIAADLIDNEWDVLASYALDGVTPTSMTITARTSSSTAPLDEVWEGLDDEWVGARELAEAVELSRSRVSKRLSELVKQGRAVKRREGRVVMFRRASFGYAD